MEQADDSEHSHPPEALEPSTDNDPVPKGDVTAGPSEATHDDATDQQPSGGPDTPAMPADDTATETVENTDPGAPGDQSEGLVLSGNPSGAPIEDQEEAHGEGPGGGNNNVAETDDDIGAEILDSRYVNTLK